MILAKLPSVGRCSIPHEALVKVRDDGRQENGWTCAPTCLLWKGLTRPVSISKLLGLEGAPCLHP